MQKHIKDPSTSPNDTLHEMVEEKLEVKPKPKKTFDEELEELKKKNPKAAKRIRKAALKEKQRNSKVLSITLRGYFMKRAELDDPNGDESVKLLEFYIERWEKHCNWGKVGYKYITPTPEAFINNVQQMVKKLQVQEKANIELAKKVEKATQIVDENTSN